MIFTICNEKGGAGKSSISQALACYLLLEKKEDTLLIDADPQRTTAEWCEERNESELPSVPCVELHGNIANELKDLSGRYKNIVIDCGGADSKAMRSALAVSDVALLPFRPKRRDLKVAPSMADTIETAKALNPELKVFSVITQAPTLPSQSNRILSAKSFLRSLELNPLEYITRNVNSWDDADESGLSVFEYKEDQKAAQDARLVFEELMGAIQ
jgi:chromosome partitioning protein